MDFILIKCPHCLGNIQVLLKDFNCKIFRHGVFKTNFKQINPHLEKSKCDELVAKNLIYGCGKPYKLIFKNKKWECIICDYL